MTIFGVIFIATAICGFAALFVYHFKRRNLYWGASKFRGPPAYPIVGSAHCFVGSTADILDKIMEIMHSEKSPVRVWLGNRLFFGIYEAEQAKTVLLSSKTLEKEDLYKFVRPWLGTGLFTAPANKWRRHRKLIMPTFNMRILKSFVDIFSKQAEIMTIQMKKELNSGEFDVFNYISLCTLDIICETAMGVSIKAQVNNHCRYLHTVNRVLEIVFSRMFKIWLHPEFIFSRTKLGQELSECLEYLHSVTRDVIQKKKAFNNETRTDDDGSSEDKPTTNKVFLDLLMELSDNGTKFTDEELREEVDTMMIAGNDTTATVNLFVMLMLATHPEVQDRVFQELCEIYGNEVCSDRPVVSDDLNRMHYLERVIKETMRLFPVGPIIVRQVSEDLDIGEYTLPKGSSAILGILMLHRSEQYWPDPMKFDPDRFLPEEVAKRHPYCYIPFSAGPRNCLGLQYAMMAMKTLLATVLRRYVVKKDKIINVKDIKLKADLMLKPVEKVTLRISERRYEKSDLQRDE